MLIMSVQLLLLLLLLLLFFCVCVGGMFQSRCNTKFSTHFTTEKKELCVTFEFKRTFFLSFFFFWKQGLPFCYCSQWCYCSLISGYCCFVTWSITIYLSRSLHLSPSLPLSLSLLFFPLFPFSFSVFL